MTPAFFNDLRYAFRDLSKNNGFTAIAVLTLAAGIGANTAMFSVVRGVLLDPLPYRQADRLYRIFYTNHEYPQFPFNPADFLDYRERNRVFESMAVFAERDLELSDPDRPERLTALRVSKDYFHVLGAAPLIGRDFQASDEIPGNQRVAILSEALWKRRFSADRGIVGRKILMEGEPFTVIGVAPAGFEHCGGDYRSPPHGATVDAWWPYSFGPSSRGSHFLNGIGRLKPGVTVADASSDMNRIAADLGATYHYTWRIFLVSLRDEIVGKSQRMLVVLLGAVAFVLLIACVNVAGLMVVRATARSRDIAVRAALGASRMRLIGASVAESLILALLGAAGGSLVAWWGVALLSKAVSSILPRADLIRIDPALFGFTLALSLLTGLLFGLAPAIRSARADLSQTLREGGRGATSGSRQSRLRNILVVGEIGLASALLIGAGLFLRSFVNLLRLDPGFRTQNVITATVVLPGSRYKDDTSRVRFFHDFLANISSLPGVLAAGASSDVPWTGWNENAGFFVEGRPSSPDDETHAKYHAATPEYFRAMGIPLLDGRFIRESDDVKAPNVIVINQSMALHYWPGENAVGKRITFSDHPKEKDWFTVIGVVGDVKAAPSAPMPEPAFWWSQYQQGFNEMLIAARTNGDPLNAIAGLRRELAQMDRLLPLSNIRTMEEIEGESRNRPRFVLALTGIFAALALALAAIGTYGVIAHSVAQRMHEFGLRIALGARTRDLLALVLAQTLRLAAIGVLMGLALSWALGRLLQGLLYGVNVRDPVTFLTAAGVSLIAALLASFIPASRAAQADPMISLRAE
jgi:predicted permease